MLLSASLVCHLSPSDRSWRKARQRNRQLQKSVRHSHRVPLFSSSQYIAKVQHLRRPSIFYSECSFCEGIVSNTRWSRGTWDVSERLEMQIRNEQPRLMSCSHSGKLVIMVKYWNGAVQLVRSHSSGLLGVTAGRCHGKSALKMYFIRGLTFALC